MGSEMCIRDRCCLEHILKIKVIVCFTRALLVVMCRKSFRLPPDSLRCAYTGESSGLRPDRYVGERAYDLEVSGIGGMNTTHSLSRIKYVILISGTTLVCGARYIHNSYIII